MVSPELLRRYPFFAGLDMDQLVTLAKVADEVEVEAGHYFFHEGEKLDTFYLILEGMVAIVVELPDRESIISTLGPGETFAWSTVVPPYTATASAKALTPCRVVAFERQALWKEFESDWRFGYLMMQRVAQVVRDRLHDTRIQSLAYVTA